MTSEGNIFEREKKRGLDSERKIIENRFLEEHRNSSDEELLGIVRKRAEELGRAPKKYEVIGFVCIKSRFGPWPRVLEKAGLKEPRAIKKIKSLGY